MGHLGKSKVWVNWCNNTPEYLKMWAFSCYQISSMKHVSGDILSETNLNFTLKLLTSDNEWDLSSIYLHGTVSWTWSECLQRLISESFFCILREHLQTSIHVQPGHVRPLILCVVVRGCSLFHCVVLCVRKNGHVVSGVKLLIAV